jgi:ribosomal protein L37AE/L43A
MGQVKTLLHTCTECGDDIDPRRVALGYRLCLWCGEEAATTERRGWTVVQEYTKGNYQFITPASVHTTLKQTNPKEIRT